MEEEPAATPPTDLAPVPPIERVHAGASDATLWLFLGGVCFMLLLCALFVFAASR